MTKNEKKIKKIEDICTKVIYTSLIFIASFLCVCLGGKIGNSEMTLFVGLVGIGTFVAIDLIIGLIAVIFVIWLS